MEVAAATVAATVEGDSDWAETVLAAAAEEAVET